MGNFGPHYFRQIKKYHQKTMDTIKLFFDGIAQTQSGRAFRSTKQKNHHFWLLL
jgi:hypothetical protein